MKRLLLAGLLLCLSAHPVAQTATLASSSITYLGAFRVPAIDDGSYGTFDYSDAAVVFYPSGDGGKGSLLIAGHPYGSKVAELRIPAPSLSRTVGDLPVASLLKPFTGVKQTNGYIMGMTYVPSEGRVYYAGSDDYFDGGCADINLASPSIQAALGFFLPALTPSDSRGIWYLGVNGAVLHPFKTSRYVMEVPKAVADASFGGRTLMSGRHRGWCGTNGPQLYAWSPVGAAPPATGTALAAKTVLQYGEGDQSVTGFSPANNYQGVVWLTSSTGAAVAITGVLDFDPSRTYYGYDNWMVSTSCDGVSPLPAACTGNRGWRAADPHPAALLYDTNDLAAVYAGTRAPSSVQPYARMDLKPYALKAYPPTMLMNGSEAETFLAAWDAPRGILYLTETRVDGLRPVVHVFSVSGSSPAPPPPPPATTDPTFVADPNPIASGTSSKLTLTVYSSDVHMVKFGSITPTWSAVNGVTTAVAQTPNLAATTTYQPTAIHSDGTPWTLPAVTVTINAVTPPPPSTGSMTGVTSSCSFKLDGIPPDSTGGWSAQFKANGSNVGSVDSSAPFSRTLTFKPGSYAFSVAWTKTGAMSVTAVGPTLECK